MSASAVASVAMDASDPDERETSRVVERRPHTDPLTGLFDRARFDEALSVAVARCVRSGVSLSLLLLDVDHLASVSERWGPVAGDLMVYRISRAIRLSVRRSDVTCRVNGDRFAVIMPGVSAPLAREVAGRVISLLRAFRSSAPAWGSAFEVSASVGVAELSPLTVLSHAQLLEAAERALDVAKRCGGDCVVSGLES